jgi:hypothetical protein
MLNFLRIMLTEVLPAFTDHPTNSPKTPKAARTPRTPKAPRLPKTKAPMKTSKLIKPQRII